MRNAYRGSGSKFIFIKKKKPYLSCYTHYLFADVMARKIAKTDRTNQLPARQDNADRAHSSATTDTVPLQRRSVMERTIVATTQTKGTANKRVQNWNSSVNRTADAY